MPRRLCWLGMLVLGLLTFTSSVQAQTSASATLYPPQTEFFPRLHAYLDIHDDQGDFVHGIQPSQVNVIENGRPLSPAEWREIRPGIQVVFALNPGPSLAVRNSQGVSRYQLIQSALLSWAKSRLGSTLDDLSLLVNDGPVRTHFNDPGELIATLESYNPDMNQVRPDLDILLNAIDLAADATPRPGMERAVVLITAPLEGDITFGLQELLTRALQQRVRLYVCLVGAPQAFESQNASLLSNLANQTGGHFYTFSGVEPFPDLEAHFEHLRSIYFLAYDSKITTGGPQEIMVEIQWNAQQLHTPPVTFNLDLRPADVAFISPPPEIIRATPSEKWHQFWEVEESADLQPQQVALQVLIEFPDGRIRPILRSALFVDGQLVDENTAPPFDHFTWNLSTYTETRQHLLQVEVVDSLGLTSRSIQLPLQVKIERPYSPSLVRNLLRQSGVILLLTLVLAGAGTILVMIWSGKIRPHLPLRRLAPQNPRTMPLLLARERLSSNVRASGEMAGRHLPQWINRIHWPQRRLLPKARAYLMRLGQDEHHPSPTPIPLIGEELTLGSDPTLATLLISEPSVDALHARLKRAADGSFWIYDEGSVAGTWVNYILVTKEGGQLKHGDLIQVGRVSFRFTQLPEGRVRQPLITYKKGQA